MALEGRNRALSDWLVLSQLYPSGGLPGVVEVPVELALYEELRRELCLVDTIVVKFSRIESVAGLSSEWFLVGDIVCRYVGMQEDYADVMRRRTDMLSYHHRFIGRADWDRIERTRALAIEHHRWEIDRVRMDSQDEFSHRRFGQTVISDPFGRTLIYVGPRSIRFWGLPFEQIDPREHRSKLKAIPAYRVAAGWLAIRVGFYRVMDRWNSREEELVCSGLELLSGVDDIVRRVYGMRTRFNDRHGMNDRCVQVWIRRNIGGIAANKNSPSRKFWERVFEEEGSTASPWLEKVRDHECMKWIRLSLLEYEELLSYSKYSEWIPGKTYRVEVVSNANTRTRWK